jgi:electron transport complex protein RnfC
MIDSIDDIVKGVALLRRFLPEAEFLFGVEENKKEAIGRLCEEFLADDHVNVATLPSLYPQGAEKVLIYNTTKRVVPEGGLPSDVGVLVMNVSTLAALAVYAETGRPLVERVVTVDGSAIREPKNLLVPIGTPIREVADACGGFTDELGKIVLGGPMTGFAAYSDDEPIVKTTNAVLAFTKAESVHRKSTACIHCGKCVEACPHLLNPTAFTKALSIDSEEERMQTLDELGVTLCVECGSCSFVCPANRPLMENNRVAKGALKSYRAAKKDLK